MALTDNEVFVAKIAALHAVVEALVVDALKATGSPIASGEAFLERVNTSAVVNHNPALRAEVAELMVSSIEDMVRRAMRKIQDGK